MRDPLTDSPLSVEVLRRGIITYDTALPQLWLDELEVYYGSSVYELVGNAVWCYRCKQTGDTMWGHPVPVTLRGDGLFARMYQDRTITETGSVIDE